MTTNKIIAEKINVFLNLLFHLEDYITNQEQREEQLHINEIVKNILREVASSETVKKFFYRGADINNETVDENEFEPEFIVDRLTEEKIKYIKRVNPQSFNQKNLEVVNYFYNSSGEADMIYDIVKTKIFTIIKYCLTTIMQKKYKEKEKQIYSKINFALVNKNNYYKNFAVTDPEYTDFESHIKYEFPIKYEYALLIISLPTEDDKWSKEHNQYYKFVAKIFPLKLKKAKETN